MLKRLSFAALAAVLAATAVVSVHADNDRHTMRLTFNRPMALPGVTLGSGTYVFELTDPSASHDAVTVRSGDRKHVLYSGMTVRISRPRTMRPDGAVLIGEVAPGQPVPIRAWFPADEQIGHEFLYR